MTRRPTPAAYRRRRLGVGLGAVAAVVLLVWLAAMAVGAVTGSHSKAAGIASASASAVAEADNTPTISVPAVPAGGRCDPGDIVVNAVGAMAHVNGSVALTFQVFTQQNPVCVWNATHATLQVAIYKHGSPFWSTADCPRAVVGQTVTLHQGRPVSLTLATWSGQASSSAGGCGSQNPWAVPGAYVVKASALGGNPSTPAALAMVAPGVVLVRPTPTVSATATPSSTGTTRPKPAAKPSASPSATTW